MSDPIRTALKQTLLGLGEHIPTNGITMPYGSNTRETSPEHLRWMVAHCLLNLEDWPVDKTSRWIGFVQGVLAVMSATFSVTEERDRTRPFFHEAYAVTGIKVPETAP